MQIEFSADFNKDLKKLKRKFRTLESDLQNFIKFQLNLFHDLKLDNQDLVEIAGLGIDYPKIYKARKFACRSLKGTGSRSGIRIIYAYYSDLDKIEFIEIYYKGDQKNENRERIEKKYS